MVHNNYCEDDVFVNVADGDDDDVNATKMTITKIAISYLIKKNNDDDDNDYHHHYSLSS